MNATKLSQLKFRPVRRPTALNFVDPLIVADLAEGVSFRTKGPGTRSAPYSSRSTPGRLY